MSTQSLTTRRAWLANLGLAGAGLATCQPRTLLAAQRRGAPTKVSELRQALREQVFQTPLIDTHEHLLEEKERLDSKSSRRVPCDDWAFLFSHYLSSDLLTAGMPKKDWDRFVSPGLEPAAKWKLVAPYWPAVKNTGYAQAVRIAISELYDIQELTPESIGKVQAGYEKMRRPGFYRHILQERARIESCQVNCLTGEPFKESDMPLLLMQDISIVGMFSGPNLQQYGPAAGVEVKDLACWHRVIDWWFEKYAKYAVAVKSQNAYSRDIDYARVPAEKAEPAFQKVLGREPVSTEERKALEDHLFWYAVDQATRHGLPVKLHTGYYAGQDSMPLARLARNPGSAGELCRLSPETKFVFMHIGYPYYEELLAVVKQWTNAHVDMCWAWLINPEAAKDYLKKHIVTAPSNKLLPFGGDYIPVEPVLGHSVLARRGIALALAELVEDGWLKQNDAMELISPLLNGNARQLFQLAVKTENLRHAGWSKS